MQAERLLLRTLTTGRHVSTRLLAEQTGLGPRATGDGLQALRDLGAPVEAARGRGWRLSRPLDLLDAAAIRSRLSPAARGRLEGLEVLLDVDSTNRRLLQSGAAGERACLAERQSAGRGRRGRGWVSPFATSLYLSLRWPSARTGAALSGLSIAAGVAVAEALRGLGAVSVGLKWPNDLVAGGAKLGGLLVEMAAPAGGGSVAVIGVGVNGALAADGAAIDQQWTDLATLLGRAPDRNGLAAAVLGALLEAVTLFERGGLEPFRARFDALDRLAGRYVRVLDASPWEGVARGIDDDGALLVEEAGRLRRVLAGDVSVRATQVEAAT